VLPCVCDIPIAVALQIVRGALFLPCQWWQFWRQSTAFKIKKLQMRALDGNQFVTRMSIGSPAMFFRLREGLLSQKNLRCGPQRSACGCPTFNNVFICVAEELLARPSRT
jgi:hypothetical protein